MDDVFAIPYVVLFQNIFYCFIVAIYSHVFAAAITGVYRLFGNGTTERINANPVSACIWRLGIHWLGAVIGLVAILGLAA